MVEKLNGQWIVALSVGEGRGLSSKRSLRPSMTSDVMVTATNLFSVSDKKQT